MNDVRPLRQAHTHILSILFNASIPVADVLLYYYYRVIDQWSWGPNGREWTQLVGSNLQIQLIHLR